MFAFYGNAACTVPCIICDAGMRILFANSTAYNEPLMLKWINAGKARLDRSAAEAMERSFDSEPFAIARLVLQLKGKPRTLLADRQSLFGTAVYVFALVRNEDSEQNGLPTELEGRRMLTACFSPLYGNEDVKLPMNAETLQAWTYAAHKAASKTGKTLDVASDVSSAGCAVKNCNALLCCASAVLAAYCASAKSHINVFVKEDRFGITLTFSAPLVSAPGSSLTSCRAASVISAYFAPSPIPILVAIQTAQSCGFDVCADTYASGNLTITLRASVFDVGDAGFKTSADFIDGTLTSIYAATELLI